METFDADKINKELSDRLSKETQELIDKAEKISESDVKEGIKIIDPDLGIRILEADEEKFDALVRLQEVLKFKNVPANELYELPGMKLGDKTITLYVPKTNIQKVADMGEYFEKELSYLPIKFPTQLYQFKKENYKKNLPASSNKISKSRR